MIVFKNRRKIKILTLLNMIFVKKNRIFYDFKT